MTTTMLIVQILAVIAVVICTFSFTLVFSYIIFNEKKNTAQKELIKQILDRLSEDVPADEVKSIAAEFGFYLKDEGDQAYD